MVGVIRRQGKPARRRAAMTSARGKGTVIEVVLPIPQEAEAP